MATTRAWFTGVRRHLRHLVRVSGVSGLLLLLLHACQVYYPDFPSRAVVATPASIGLAYEPVSIATEDGLRLDAWYVPAPDARGVVLLFHGNAGNISHRLETIEIFHRLRLSTLIFDYRGYGRSEGEPSEVGTYRDAEAAWRYLTQVRGVAGERIVLFGRSLGGAIAAWTASRYRAAALILESTFTSVPDMANYYIWMLPAGWLTRERYATKQALKTVSGPVLVIHSRTDEVVPYEHGRTLFDVAREPKRFLEINGDHNTGFLVTGQRYVEGLDDFLTATLGR